MPDKQNIIRFPTSARRRKALLSHAEDARLRRLVRLRSTVGWLLVFSMILFAAVNFTLFTPSAIRRNFERFALALTDPAAAQGDIFNYPAGTMADAAPLGTGVAVLDDESLFVLRAGGAIAQTINLGYTSPCLESAGDYVLAYDRGSYSLTLASTLAASAQVTLKSAVQSATLSASGRFAAVTDEVGYKSAVTVFSPRGEELHKWMTSDYYIQAAALSPSGNHLCVLAFRQENTDLISELLFLDVGREGITATVPMGETVGYTLRWIDDGTVAAIGDNQVCTADRRGQHLGAVSFSPSDLLAFAIGDDGFSLAQRAWTSSTRATLTSYDKNCGVRAQIPLDEDPTSLAQRDGQIAVLSAGGLSVYSTSLAPSWRSTGAAAAQRVQITDDGAALLLYSKYAQRLTAASDGAAPFSLEEETP